MNSASLVHPGMPHTPMPHHPHTIPPDSLPGHSMVSPAPRHPVYAPHSHDPDLAAHHYRRLAAGRFALLRTQGGRFYAVIEVETGLGDIHAMIELRPHAAAAIAHAQREHPAREHAAGRAIVTGAGGIFYQDEMAVGAMP